MRTTRFALGALGVALGWGSPTFATCFDQAKDGLETDVDCGGDCAPCTISQACSDPRDCESGRCAEGKCEEQRLESTEPPPRGYHAEVSRTDGAATCRLLGFISLGASYGASYAMALSLPGNVSWLYVPVLGPWIKVSDSQQSLRGVIAIDGFFQTVGAGLLIGGLVASGRQAVRDDSGLARVEVVPLFGPGGGGAAVVGVF